MSSSRLARGAGLLSIVLLMLGAYGCDQLGMGGKTETKKDTAKAAKDDESDDDDKDKKKKKKKSKDNDQDDKEADAKDAKEKPATTVAGVPAPPPVPVPAATGATTTPPATPLPPIAPPPATPTLGGNSPVPSVADWDGVTNEVTVRGSSALNCETKMLREWVRVSCRGKNSTGGTPTTVNITSGGGRGNEFVFASAGVTSLVVRFLEGVDLKADFGWTDGSYNLHVWWPRGAPNPPAKGVFTRN